MWVGRGSKHLALLIMLQKVTRGTGCTYCEHGTDPSGSMKLGKFLFAEGLLVFQENSTTLGYK